MGCSPADSVTGSSSLHRALAAALSAWGGAERERILSRLSPSLRAAAERPTEKTEDSALSFLKSVHNVEARFDPEQVHATWWVRALADESEAVKRVVARRGPKSVAKAARIAFGLDEYTIRPDHPPHPLAERWALSLWSERLVGGPATTQDDPLVVRAVAGCGQRPLKSLVALIARSKRAYNPLNVDERDAEARRESFWPDPDPRLAELARRDVANHPGMVYRDLPALGLVTLGRLLEEVEPFRARWAVQHLPYPVAKAVRALRSTETDLVSLRELLDWEHRILESAINDWGAQSS